MNTNEDLINKLEWNNNIKNREEKEVLARKIASKVRNGDVISFGSGTTSFLTVKEIGKRCKNEGLDIIAVPTSEQIKTLCDYLGIKTANLEDCKIDWGFDGADEVDKNNWLIKGLGGALYKEKRNLGQTPIMYILVDKTKLVDELGEKCPVPVEVKKDRIDEVIQELYKLGAKECKIRMINDEKYVTDIDNYIIDARFNKIAKNLEEKINDIDGVIDNGLFINYENLKIITI